MDLLEKVADRLGVGSSSLQYSIESGINAHIAMLFIIGILIVAITIIYKLKKYLDDEILNIKVNSIVWLIFFIGCSILLNAIYSATAYAGTYMVKLIELAKSLGVL